MQITALTDIVQGELINSPSISFITQIHTNISKINEGDAFFATNKQAIEYAIKKGVFAIIYDFETIISDNEIAWIKVDNFQKAITNILRYKLIESKTEFIKTNKIFFHLLTIFKSKEFSDTILLKENLSDNFELLNSIDCKKIIFGTDLKFLNAISGKVSILEHNHYDIKNLITHSLFETSFSYKDKFFDKLKLPTVYIDDLVQQLELFEYKLDLKKLNNFDLFKPIFINKNNEIVNFGQTNKFILANKDIEIYDIEINYLQSHYSYGDIKTLDATKLNNDELFSIIKDLEFNALYCKNISIKQISSILEKNYAVDNFII